MPTEVVTPQSAAEQSVSAPTQNSALDEQAHVRASEASTESSPAGGEAQSELHADDYESLEDFAQALIERKQSARNDQSSATEDDGDEEDSGDLQQPGREEDIRSEETGPDDR